MTKAKKQSGMKCMVYVSATSFLPASGSVSTTPPSLTVKAENVLAGQRNATLNRSAETIDATSKDTEGNWMESIPGFKSWGVECESCYIADDKSYIALEKAYLEGSNVHVAILFGKPVASDATGSSNPKIQGMAGEATITDFPIELPYNDLASYSLTLQGSGALVKGEIDKFTANASI